MSDILERLRGYNPIDRTSDNIRAATDIHDAADEIDRLRRGIKTIWSMCLTCNYVEPVQEELERLMNGHEPVKQDIPDNYVDKAKQRLTTERDEARRLARTLWSCIVCNEIHHAPSQYHDHGEECKAKADILKRYPWLNVDLKRGRDENRNDKEENNGDTEVSHEAPRQASEG